MDDHGLALLSFHDHCRRVLSVSGCEISGDVSRLGARHDVGLAATGLCLWVDAGSVLRWHGRVHDLRHCQDQAWISSFRGLQCSALRRWSATIVPPTLRFAQDGAPSFRAWCETKGWVTRRFLTEP